jgi:hypothetical protein
MKRYSILPEEGLDFSTAPQVISRLEIQSPDTVHLYDRSKQFVLRLRMLDDGTLNCQVLDTLGIWSNCSFPMIEAEEKGDFALNSTGSIVLLTPESKECSRWLDINLAGEVSRFGMSIAVEARYIEDIVEGLLRDGLKAAPYPCTEQHARCWVRDNVLAAW